LRTVRFVAEPTLSMSALTKTEKLRFGLNRSRIMIKHRISATEAIVKTEKEKMLAGEL